MAMALAAVALLPGGTTSAAASTAPADVFSFNWTGRPSAPQPWSPQGWDVIVHSRDERTWQTLDPVPAQHGPDCAAPPAVHTVTSYADAVFICNNHLMTAFLPGGYGEIEMTPDRLLDWSGGTAVVSWHQSTFRTSPRDWTDVTVTPFADNLVLPADVSVDLSGEPRNAVHVAMTQSVPTAFDGDVIEDFQRTPLGGRPIALERVLPPSAVQRAHFQLELSRTHVRFGLPDQGVWWIDRDIPPLPFTSGVVQLGHHSYTPDKECAPTPGVLSCTGDTWHWSDFQMAPAHAFSMIHGDAGLHVSHDTARTVHFPVEAPAGSFLRFAGIGAIQVSFDGGASWSEPRIQPADRNRDGSFRGSLFNSYWMPVPKGTTEVTFSGQDTYFSWWWVRDPSIWSSADPSGLVPASTTTLPIFVAAPPSPGRRPAPVPAPVRLLGAFGTLLHRAYRALVPYGDDYVLFAFLAGAAAATAIAAGHRRWPMR